MLTAEVAPRPDGRDAGAIQEKKSMVVAVPREQNPEETRVAATPPSVERLVKLGAHVVVERGAGELSLQPDSAYVRAGASVSDDRLQILSSADIVLRVEKPPLQETGILADRCFHVSHLNPFHERELVLALAERGARAVSMEMLPRTTRAQKMDALSSQASLAGYVAVVLAAERLRQVLPMMVTPAGTLSPARFFVIGAGVAGLQAIATARRLGAIVDAFDTRPAVEEQVRSLGARFLKVDLGETGETEGGYARQLTPAQLAAQREAMARACANADAVITTAQVFGRDAPRIVTAEMVSAMKPGSVIVDMAVESGGNVEGSVLGSEQEVSGVRIVGYPSLARRVPAHASQVYAANLASLLEEFWDREKNELAARPDDEILSACLLTDGGAVVNARIKEAYRA
jgi:NAD(P) transhydrogenase subunit alpha